jgi:hypothetical protein
LDLSDFLTKIFLCFLLPIRKKWKSFSIIPIILLIFSISLVLKTSKLDFSSLNSLKDGFLELVGGWVHWIFKFCFCLWIDVMWWWWWQVTKNFLFFVLHSYQRNCEYRTMMKMLHIIIKIFYSLISDSTRELNH